MVIIESLFYQAAMNVARNILSSTIEIKTKKRVGDKEAA
jgi:hypothetical protein